MTIDTPAVRAAEILLDLWNRSSRCDHLPEDLKPRGRAEGYRIGAEIARLAASPVVGWKIAATSVAGQKHINVDGPLGGRLLKSRIVSPGASIPLANNIMRVAEVEFAFAFAKALPQRVVPYTRDEVFDAVSGLRLSIEVPDSRYQDFTAVGAPQLIADTACASWLMLSPPIEADWRSVDLSAHAVRALVNGTVVAEGTGKAALGDPREALVWLVNEVCQFADGIKAGDTVTTGTCVVPAAIAPGDTVTADYGPFGTMTARII